jgi:hypothetical protein
MGSGQDKRVCGRPLSAWQMAQAMSEKIRASVTVLEFVSQYVELKPTAPHTSRFRSSDAKNDCSPGACSAQLQCVGGEAFLPWHGFA